MSVLAARRHALWIWLASSLLVASVGCGSSGAAPPACLVNEDCGPDQFCDATETRNSDTCHQTQPGVCRNVAYSADGKACTSNDDCRGDGLVCYVSEGQCGLEACLVEASGAGLALPACSGTGCRVGTRSDSCLACFCLSCPIDAGEQPDASGDAG